MTANTVTTTSALEEIKATWLHLLVSISNLVVTSFWFVAIFLAAAGIGYATQWMAIHCVWVPEWMLKGGHLLEGALFLMDCFSLVKKAWKHLA